MGRITLKWIFKKWNVEHGQDRIQDRGRWRAVVNVVMNILFPKTARNFLGS